MTARTGESTPDGTCCFCGQELERASTVELAIHPAADRSEVQGLWAHRPCLSARLHPSIPRHPALMVRGELGVAGDVMIRARRALVNRLLREVVDGEEQPVFVSDQATLFDLSSRVEATLRERIRTTYGVTVTPAELRLPVWQLVDRLASAP